MNSETGIWVGPGNIASPAACASLKGHVESDTAVIGGGFTGLLCALKLAEAGENVVLLEEGSNPAVEAAHAAGTIIHTGSMMLHERAAVIGTDAAVQFQRFCCKAAADLQRLGTQLPHAAIQRRSSLRFADSDADTLRLAREYRAFSAHGIPAAFLEESELRRLYPFRKAAAFCTHGHAEMNPAGFADGLAERARTAGVRLYGDSAVLGREQAGRRYLLHTALGRVSARSVIYAGGQEGPGAGCSRKNRVRKIRTYAGITPPLHNLDRWEYSSFLENTEQAQLRVRTTPEGRLLASVTEHAVPDRPVLPSERQASFRNLQDKLRDLFPEHPVSLEKQWILHGEDAGASLPVIGEDSEKRGIYYGFGSGYNQPVLSMLAADILTCQVQGQTHPAAELFRTSSKLSNVV
ncbi:NAD(P)/FAD-dependent oxidoreductase [Paenibacillus gansuensis]|uniref:NAD(P)/FAD-dependent oxidoreductase n=1 Tax=Paenibacillus gansuensis TaxID=306542 RepID=A0ABW5P958_9BACL